MPTELESLSERYIQRTLVQKDGDYYVISTITLDDDVSRSLDSMLTTLGGTVGGEVGERAKALDHSNGEYETMVFECDEEGEVTNWAEVDISRYHTEEEAREGHATMVDKWDGTKN